MSKQELESLNLGKFHTYLAVRPDRAYVQKKQVLSLLQPYSVDSITQQFYNNIGLKLLK